LEIEFVYVPAGKRRLSGDLKFIRNFLDLFKIFFGVIIATFKMFWIYPDVIFGKGGYPSFPAYFAAKLLRIPLIIHESDSVPGRVNAWGGKFAEKIALSYKEAGQYFPADKIAYTGQPIRREIREVYSTGAFEYLNLESNIPVVLIIGGSLGAQLINDAILTALPKLLEKYQIIHQVGKANFKNVRGVSEIILEKHPHKDRYKPFDYLNTLALKMAAGAASVVVSRGGSTVFEIACWGLPAIIIPITISNGDHQRKNAYSYARDGGAVVVEEANLSAEIIVNEIDRILSDKGLHTKMVDAAKKTASHNAGNVIAQELVRIALDHENK
jgi:UDP-N-acetylglucosamine--N-acetylmuramyl-(pentapeptide) pyrophosphoryl-undecaprenol N-acetylglucosamine transferase